MASPRRCRARLKHKAGRCRNWPVPGEARCGFHGGLSSGPRYTPPEKIAERAKKMAAGRDAHFARLHAAGLKHCGGRPPANESPDARRRRFDAKIRRREAKLVRLKEEKIERAWAALAEANRREREAVAPPAPQPQPANDPFAWIERMREGRERAIAEPAYLKWLNAGGATPDILPVYEILSAKVDRGPRRPKRDY
jgi:hypothetical protein